MVDNSWLIILSIGFFLLSIGIIVAIGFLIYLFIEIRRITARLNEFMRNTEERIMPALSEAEQTLRSFRKISDDIGTVTQNVRGLSDVTYEILANLNALSRLVNDFGEGVSLRASGIKVGVRTAFNFLINQIKERR